MSTPDPLRRPNPFDFEVDDEPEIPEYESRHLSHSTARAHEFAKDGKVLTGYLILYAGILVIRDRHEAWVPAAQCRWERALALFKSKFPRNWEKYENLDP